MSEKTRQRKGGDAEVAEAAVGVDAGKVTRTQQLVGGGAGGETGFGPMPFLDVMAMGGGLPAVQRKGGGDGATVPRGGGTHVVKAGETLWTIAVAAYGEGRHWTRSGMRTGGRWWRGI